MLSISVCREVQLVTLFGIGVCRSHIYLCSFSLAVLFIGVGVFLCEWFCVSGFVVVGCVVVWVIIWWVGLFSSEPVWAEFVDFSIEDRIVRLLILADIGAKGTIYLAG